jgi:hypothetical protein
MDEGDKIIDGAEGAEEKSCFEVNEVILEDSEGAAVSHRVQAVAHGGGRIEPEDVHVATGSDLRLTVEPDEGQECKMVKLNGYPLSLSQGGNSVILVRIGMDTVVEAWFDSINN